MKAFLVALLLAPGIADLLAESVNGLIITRMAAASYGRFLILQLSDDYFLEHTISTTYSRLDSIKSIFWQM